MRSLVALLIVGAGASVALAQPGSTPPGQPGQPPVAVAQPVPTPVPVPNLPVVEKKELEGGLIIEDMKIGDGPEVKPGDAVTAFYHGTLKDTGTEFDSAYTRGEPSAFSLNGVVQGWAKGVPGMRVGGIRKLTIPAALGYGDAGNPPKIPAKADLVFVIQIDDLLRWEDISPGTGEEIWGMAVAVAKQTIKTADGATTTNDNPPYIWLPGEVRYSPRDDAVQSALKGMKVGGKRKIHLPKEMNPALPEVTSRPTGVACDIELELIAMRNLTPKPQVPVVAPPVAVPVPPPGTTPPPPPPTPAPK